jgi:hypothetical protein
MGHLIKDDISLIKSKLEAIEHKLHEQVKEFEQREDIWDDLDKKVKTLLSAQKDIVRLNVGGTPFRINKEILLSIDGALFKTLLEDFNPGDELFIDRPAKYFPMILDYLRHHTSNYKRLGKYQIELFHDEVEYYKLHDLNEELRDYRAEVKLISLEFSGEYRVSNALIGTNKLEDIMTKDQTGVVCASPGWIIVELDREWEVDEINVQGYLNTRNWNSNNGCGSKVSTSVDKGAWTEVGTLPGNIQTVQKVNLIKTKAKYLKIQHSGPLGIGYLYVYKVNRNKNN